jgi:hypothetical protein
MLWAVGGCWDCRSRVRAEGHVLEREIRHIEQSEAKVKMEIKKLAKVGEMGAARMLAKVSHTYSYFCCCLLSLPNSSVEYVLLLDRF